MQHRLSIRSRDSWSLPVRDLFNSGIEAKKELSCINSRKGRGSGNGFQTRNPVENGGMGEGEKIKEGTVGSQVSPRLIRSEKFGEGWRREETFRGGGWPRETFIFQRSGRSSIYMIKFHLIRLPFSSKLYRLPESK